MFIREKTSPTTKNTYLQIVKSYRKGGKVRQRVVASLGNISKLRDSNELRKIALALLDYCSDKPAVAGSSAKEIRRVIWGPVLCYAKLWKRVGMDRILKKIAQGHQRLQMDLEKAAFLMVVQHLTRPMSKLGTWNSREKLWGEYEMGLQHLYRTLDIIADNKERIEWELFSLNRNLFNNSTDVVFWDTTTLYFDSQKEGGYRRFGFSKDGKARDVQVVLGLLVDKEGRPLGFEVFRGDTFDGHTLSEALGALKSRFNIDRVIIVADRAMFSRANIEQIRQLGYEYIISARIRNLSGSIKQQITDTRRYKKLEDSEDGQLLVYETGYKGDRLICTWSSKRAQKDAWERQMALRKIQQKIASGAYSFITNNLYKRYLRFEDGKAVIIDQDKVQEDCRWDGFYAIVTNAKKLPAQKILFQYHNLWKVDESFRVMKSHLEARPMFHWTDKRIKGHLVLCFIAFLLLRELQLILRKKNKNFSAEKIREALTGLQVSELKIQGRYFLLRSPVGSVCNDILRALSIKIPPSIQEGKLP